MTGLWRILLRMKANYADKREKNCNQTMFFFYLELQTKFVQEINTNSR